MTLDSGLLSPVRAGTAIEPLVDDSAWLRSMLDAEAALARAQARLGAVPERAAAAITAAAKTTDFDIRDLALAARQTANPVVALVAALTRAVGPEHAEHVHRGSTSQDILDTGPMLVSARALDLIAGLLTRTAATLDGLARTHRDTPMAGRTLALHAVPTTFGLRAAGWAISIRDAAGRAASLRARLPVSLGGAAGTLAAYQEYAALDGDYPLRLVTAYAAETGLAAPALPWHTRRTPIADLGAVCALATGTLGKMAVDVLTLSRTEIGELSEPGGNGRGASSAMPHKRNPVSATLLRSAALQVPVLAAGLTQAMLSEDDRAGGVWQSEWLLLRECLRLTGGAAETALALAGSLTVHADRMRTNLDLTAGSIVSERLVAALTPLLDRATVRALLNDATAEAARTGRPLAEVLAESPSLTDVDLTALLDPAGYLGAAPRLVDRACGIAGFSS